MKVWQVILLILALLILAPIGDAFNRWARTGGQLHPTATRLGKEPATPQT